MSSATRELGPDRLRHRHHRALRHVATDGVDAARLAQRTVPRTLTATVLAVRPADTTG